MKNKLYLLFVLVLSLPGISFAQDDDLWKSLNADSAAHQGKVIATFKTTRIINGHSIETVKAKSLDFRITHRFGNIGGGSGGGVHSFYGFDNASNIRLSLEYGISDRLMVGLGRSKMRENLDGFVKYRILEQEKGKIPVSVALIGSTVLTPERSSVFYSDVVNADQKFAHRLTYTLQAMIARKVSSSLSLQVLPVFVHRNFVKNYTNPDNNATETNNLFAMGFGGRFKFTKRSAIIAEYFHTFSGFRRNNPTMPYYAPLSIGYEIETGGHVFHINLTNAAGLIESDFITTSSDNWLKGGYKFGFNISRVFQF